MVRQLTFWAALVLVGVVMVRGDPDGEAHVHTVSASSPDNSANVVGVSSTSGDSDAYASIAKVLSENPTLAAAAAAAFGGDAGTRGAYNYPSAPGANPRPNYPYGGGYGFPWGGLGGFGKGFNLNLDASGFGGLGGIGGGYYPVIEKVIVIIGGGILILLIIAFIQGSLSPGGFLHALGGGFSNAIAGAASLDIGPIHKSAAGAASFNDGFSVGGGHVNDPRFNHQVTNSFNRKF